MSQCHETIWSRVRRPTGLVVSLSHSTYAHFPGPTYARTFMVLMYIVLCYASPPQSFPTLVHCLRRRHIRLSAFCVPSTKRTRLPKEKQSGPWKAKQVLTNRESKRRSCCCSSCCRPCYNLQSCRRCRRCCCYCGC
jgi:hypothetical protein